MVGRNHNDSSTKEHVQKWHVMQEQQDVHDHEQEEPCSSFEEASTTSNESSSISCSSSLDDTLCDDDASSSSAHSSRSSLYDLSDLMSHLPINRRGLSKFYHGKSDSFTSLARVTSIEDLPKKEKVPCKKMKNSNSYKSHTLPKPIISKKKTKRKQFGSSSIKKDFKE